MKSLLLRLLDRLGSPIVVVGALASALCVFLAIGVVISGLAVSGQTAANDGEHAVVEHAGTVELATEGALESTPEPVPTVELPPLILSETPTPTRTDGADGGAEGAFPSAASGAGESGFSGSGFSGAGYPDSGFAGSGSDAGFAQPSPSATPSGRKTFGQWLGSIFKPNPSAPPSQSPSPTPADPSPSQHPVEPSPTPPVAESPVAEPPASEPPVSGSPKPAPPGPTPPAQPAPRGDIAALLATLDVRGEDTRGKYKRDEFGKTWTKDSRGCRTRHVILERDLTNIQYEHKCKVASGVLNDPYTGKTINFVAGPDTSDDVQIDHVVALRDAWGTGAQNLDKERRINFANDPLNLIAVDGKANTAKGHKNAAAWLPPNESFRCHYVARQIAVKARHHLWVSQPEHDALTRALSKCPAGMRVHGDTIEGV